MESEELSWDAGDLAVEEGGVGFGGEETGDGEGDLVEGGGEKSADFGRVSWEGVVEGTAVEDGGVRVGG